MNLALEHTGPVWTRQARGPGEENFALDPPRTWIPCTRGLCGRDRRMGLARVGPSLTPQARGSAADSAFVDSPGTWVRRTQGLVDASGTWFRHAQRPLWTRQAPGYGMQGPPKARQARRFGPAGRTVGPTRIVVPAITGGKEASWQAAVAPGGKNGWKH